MTDIKIVCGLGNPGSRYEHTRHNLGYSIIDRLATELGLPRPAAAGTFECRAIPGLAESVQLIKPLISVNRAGVAVRGALERFDVRPGELFVISDDFHLRLGVLRIRKTGSAGGHNGLQSIIDEIGTEAFPRMRAGIGPLPESAAQNPGIIPDFVLSRFETDEEEIIATMLSRAVDAVRLVIDSGLDRAISRYNSSDPTPEA